jgi:hypothetical protein
VLEIRINIKSFKSQYPFLNFDSNINIKDIIIQGKTLLSDANNRTALSPRTNLQIVANFSYQNFLIC